MVWDSSYPILLPFLFYIMAQTLPLCVILLSSPLFFIGIPTISASQEHEPMFPCCLAVSITPQPTGPVETWEAGAVRFSCLSHVLHLPWLLFCPRPYPQPPWKQGREGVRRQEGNYLTGPNIRWPFTLWTWQGSKADSFSQVALSWILQCGQCVFFC